uniref:Endonuclease/exonuclease/phosphatase domain-containing protein n=1 Tax=Sander lucioperca TaxID=283035 RepID=A0A8D0AHZ7_SANLU
MYELGSRVTRMNSGRVLETCIHTHQMAELSILSVNIRGLNGPIKRAKFLDYLRRKNIDVALIQESHLCKRDVNRLQNIYFKVAASSSDDTKTKGSIVLLFLSRLTNELLSLNEYSLIIGRDMNAVLDLNQDRSGVNHTRAQKLISDMFNAVVESHHLTDIWSMHNPTSKDYIFFSTPIEPAILSDHNTLITTFHCDMLGERSRRWQFNNSLLQNTDFDTEFRAKLEEFISINTDSVLDPAYIWQATKGFIRDITSSFAANLKKKRETRIAELEERCKSLEQSLKTCFFKSTHTLLVTNRAELNDLLKRRAEFIMHRVRQNYYFNGCKPSKLLALKLKQTNMDRMRRWHTDKRKFKNSWQHKYFFTEIESTAVCLICKQRVAVLKESHRKNVLLICCSTSSLEINLSFSYSYHSVIICF